MHPIDLDAAWAITSKRVKPNKESRAAFLGALLCRHNPDIQPHHAAAHVAALQLLARRIKTLCEHDCTVGLDDRQEKRLAAMSAELIKLAQSLGFNATAGGDPRGACAYLLHPADEKAGDGWGGGWAIFS